MKLFRISNYNKSVNNNIINLHTDNTSVNPFVIEIKSNNKVKQCNLLLELKSNQSKNINNNSFLAAVVKCDPYAVMGLMTQIRIA